MYFLFFSSRRRHTRCALVTGFRRVLFRSVVCQNVHRPRFDRCQNALMEVIDLVGHAGMLANTLTPRNMCVATAYPVRASPVMRIATYRAHAMFGNTTA